ncbi:MAG: O-antigen ligase family protein [Verrucomicrobiaceae bacterium]|nr:MAG: O-antigen ligase family protein [Verrucomicrobiaceae bacterium]
MEFFFAVFFLLFYFLRPQDWVPGLMGMNLIKPIIVMWVAVLFTGRSIASPFPGLLKTPHDWIILSYFVYVVWTAPDSGAAFSGFLPLVAFYVLTVQSISSWERLLSYLKWWMIALVVIAIIANLIPLGIDLTGAKDYLDEIGRLSIGTWLHNNPNALAHSVVVVIPIAYLLFFWRGGPVGKWILFPLFAGLAYWCVFQTASKGSFLVGGITLVSVFIIGRPKFVQILVAVVALTVGMSALSFLPRMAQMNDLRADEGVQGRLLAWEMARGVTQTRSTGQGWQQFIALIEWKDGDTIIHDLPKATHSSYVQVGADLGTYGLFLYVAGLWCAAHTLLRFRPANDDEDRCRRALAVLLLATAFSGWMINRQYHTEHFLLIAATAALHRLRMSREGVSPATVAAPAEDKLLLSADPDELESGDLGEMQEPTRKEEETAPIFSTGSEPEALPPKPFWNRLGVIDLAVCAGLTSAIFWIWDYIIANI